MNTAWHACNFRRTLFVCLCACVLASQSCHTQGSCATFSSRTPWAIADWTSCSATCFNQVLNLQKLCQGCPRNYNASTSPPLYPRCNVPILHSSVAFAVQNVHGFYRTTRSAGQHRPHKSNSSAARCAPPHACCRAMCVAWRHAGILQHRALTRVLLVWQASRALGSRVRRFMASLSVAATRK